MKKIYLIILTLGVGISQLTAQSPHFFGVTTNGSGSGAGTIYRTDTNGTNFSLIDTFDILKNGVQPFNQELVEVSGKMYGVTRSGGNNGNGVFFEFDPATGSYIVRHHFNDSTGKFPQCYLLLGSNGKIYGTAQQGGANNTGTLYEYNTTTNTLTRKVSFGIPVNGRYPSGKMVETSTGVFYGVSTSGGVTYAGTIFKYTLSTNILEKKDEFLSALNGSSPEGGLMKASSGILYGMTARGGSSGAGTLFQYDLTADSIKTLIQFNGQNGRNGKGTVIEINGGLYGLTNYGTYSTSGTGKGLLFRYDISSDTITRLRAFGSRVPGYYPSGELVPSTAGKFLILMRTGGIHSYAGAIAEYTVATNGIVNVGSFDRSLNGTSPQGNLKKSSVNGKYYGVAGYGGAGDFGTIFEFDHAIDTIINKHSFSPSDNGKKPTGTLVKAPNGKLYGITQAGGIHGNGTIFEVDPVTETVVKRVDFDLTVGKRPVGGLTLATNGKLYGVTSNGGASDRGVIFEYNISANTLVKLKDVYPLGNNPYAGLIQATNGKLYGTTLSGGIGYGIIYSYDIALDTMIRCDMFNRYDDGGHIQSRLMQATNGKLYGAARSYGTHGLGTVFEFDITADSIRAIDHFTDSNGSNPYGGLTQTANGNIYGITNRGNITGVGSKYGVVYQLDLVADTIIPLHNFVASVHGYGGYGEFLEASNGKLYVTSSYSSSGDRTAIINEFDPIANTFLAKSRVFGSTYGNLIELVSPNSASIGEKEIAQELLVYPNPTNSILNIDTKGERIIGLKIYSVSGQLIDSKLKGNNTIDVAHYQSGLYIIQVEMQNGIALSRFIKK
jgi:uncharacterized repeat protein (TIGR03803 family)